MIKKIWLSTVCIFTCFALSSCTIQQAVTSNNEEVTGPAAPSMPPSPEASIIPVETTAQFEIYTRGTKRIFTQSMYHRQSPDVYIEKLDPSTIHVLKKDITWNEFFKTLPFSLSKECLVTGTKQTFCSNDNEKLRFYINESETPNALDLPIKHNDFLKVIYGT
ncbi:hypothetical protein KBC79_00935 [Candidatus Woesebacteria bacterium]|nr:hypothetical protein [Candidatus Woesebacteria bacterium]